MREWRRQINMRAVFGITEEFFGESPVRMACNKAVGRLPPVQREVIAAYFFDGVGIGDLAATRKVTESTIYNHKAQAQRKLHDDDRFFLALVGLGVVRDRARADDIRARYPDGRRPDGRRVVAIDQAA